MLQNALTGYATISSDLGAIGARVVNPTMLKASVRLG